MHESIADLPVAVNVQGVLIRMVEWGPTVISVESFPAGTDSAPFYRGLPDNRCQCPHWGYLIKGRARYRYADHEEVVEAGSIYHLEPGHTCFFEEATELIEFSPAAQHRVTMENGARALAEMLATSGSAAATRVSE